MKFNKKLVVTSLSTVLGLGIVGSITGTVAWYQYSTRATTSIMAVTSGEAGVLKIKEHNQTSYTKTDLVTNDLKGSNTGATLYPVTFGGFAKNAALPSAAYVNPEAGEKKINLSTNVAGSDKEYIQFSVDLAAVKADGTRAALPVYISDLVLEDADTGSTSVTPALRMHIACGSSYWLVGGAGATASLNCYGALDLNGDGADDTTNDSVYEWERATTPTTLNYGFYNGEPEALVEGVQTVYQASEVVNGRDSDGKLANVPAKLIGTTGASDLTVTVTIWLEGWESLGGDQEWPANTTGRHVHAGITFDVGARAFDD